MDSKQKADILTDIYIGALSSSPEALAGHAHVLGAILDSIGDALIVWDREHKTILANQAMFALTGRPELTTLTRHEVLAPYSFFREDGVTVFPDEDMPYEHALRNGRPASSESLARGPNLPQEGKWMRVLASPILDKENVLLGVVTVVQDISERKQLERQRNALATLITHDLKNHLVSWDAVFQIIEPEINAKVDADLLRMMQQLQQNNRQFTDMANTLLELYRSDIFAIKAARSRVDLSALIHSAVQINEQYARALGVKLKVEIKSALPMVTAVPAALRQGLHNLVQNAIEACNGQGIVQVKASANSDHVTVAVQDDGPGIPADKIHKLFEQAQTTEALPKATSSTGFGLYLTRLLVEAQGGEISCTSEIDKGTIISVKLPCG